MAKAKNKAPQDGEANGFRVGDTGVKVGDMVYAAGSVIPKELVTDEIAPYLIGEANMEDTPGEVIVETTIPVSTDPIEDISGDKIENTPVTDEIAPVDTEGETL